MAFNFYFLLKIVGILIFSYFFAILQTSFFSQLFIDKISFQFLFIVIFLWNLFEPSEKGLAKVGAFFTGLFFDIFTDLPLGAAALSFFAVSTLLKKALQGLEKINFIIVALLFLVHFFLFKVFLLFWSLVLFLPESPSFGLRTLLQNFHWEMFLNLLLMAFLYYLILGSRKLYHKFLKNL